MPIVGDIQKGRQIGKFGKSGGSANNAFIYCACIDCGKERWVDFKVGENKSSDLRCCSCSRRLTAKNRTLRNFAEGTLENPEVGDIRRIKDLGYKRGNPYSKYIWVKCLICDKGYWVYLRHSKPATLLCRSCSAKEAKKRHPQPRGEYNKNWKGGRRYTGDGHIEVKIPPESPFYSMVVQRRYVLEHRLVMAKYLNRCLTSKELVHHVNGIKDDNRIENLQLRTLQTHPLSYQAGYRSGYQKGYGDGNKQKYDDLKKQIRLLQWQLNEVLGERKLL